MEQVGQPTASDIRQGILHFPGPLVTGRSFKQSATNRLRATSNEEFSAAIEILAKENKGAVVEVPVPRHAKPVSVFVKKPPSEITFAQDSEKELYQTRYILPVHKSISDGIRNRLREKGHLKDQH
eukprot:Seg1121.31 transcript_id=Seg1121.31/GoldUCD/mRNA.D3Y31 product="hypothetical protein" protein_id=Seg1121.31/GoldUCD/D3Y31